MRRRGEMLWFNATKNLGAVRSDAGERLDVEGDAFAADAKPTGRCAGRAVEFECVDNTITAVTFVVAAPSHRARRRRRP